MLTNGVTFAMMGDYYWFYEIKLLQSALLQNLNCIRCDKPYYQQKDGNERTSIDLMHQIIEAHLVYDLTILMQKVSHGIKIHWHDLRAEGGVCWLYLTPS